MEKEKSKPRIQCYWVWDDYRIRSLIASVGMRNQLVHGYFSVKLDRVWATIHEDLPALIARLAPMLQEQGA